MNCELCVVLASICHINYLTSQTWNFSCSSRKSATTTELILTLLFHVSVNRKLDFKKAASTLPPPLRCARRCRQSRGVMVANCLICLCPSLSSLSLSTSSVSFLLPILILLSMNDLTRGRLAPQRPVGDGDGGVGGITCPCNNHLNKRHLQTVLCQDDFGALLVRTHHCVTCTHFSLYSVCFNFSFKSAGTIFKRDSQRNHLYPKRQTSCPLEQKSVDSPSYPSFQGKLAQLDTFFHFRDGVKLHARLCVPHWFVHVEMITRLN